MGNITIESQNGVKRAWVTPDIEIISSGDIQGGPNNFNEGSTSNGNHGSQS